MTKLRRISFIILFFYFFTVFAAGHIYWNTRYQRQIDTNLAELSRFASQLNSQLEKYIYIPRLLSKDSELIDALAHPGNSAQIEITNRYLENVAEIVEASDIYLLDTKGTTISASNWQKENTFIGRNFSFRPYFQQAMEEKSGQYFALGSTSGKRGFYYSYPVIYAAETLGVVVVKTNLSNIEESWSNSKSHLVVTDFDGVIFMSSKPEWLFNSFLPLEYAKKQEIKDSQRYLNKEINTLSYSFDHQGPTGELARKNPILYAGTYLSAKRSLDSQQLMVRVLSPKVQVFWSTFGFIIVITLIYALILACWLLIRSRQIKRRQIAQIEAESKQKLEFLVMERTAELQVEIAEREKTEQALRMTQNELIQAAKLAVLGEMSASISHELNNPLAAIRSFAENGKKFLDKGQPERTSDNLTRISALTDRMAKISQQLKSFAKKSSSEELVEAQIQPVITSALELMKTRLRANQIELTTAFPKHRIKARINPIQLEQVLINLISNAIEALNKSEKKQIYITLTDHGEAIKLQIEDSGSGISKNVGEQLFQPFYTTKQNGLGLGLSISRQIMNSMNGTLEIEDSALGGACLTISIAQQQ
ncbi:ATP-binding protein [Vibrio sp. HN007]|uniref:ATP-binding protein n=1 Tax=Vibrio iocasae TaxID=3098914 RepID=UPI0035D43234